VTELNDIVEDFDLLGDWDSRYQYLIELGERLAPMAEADRTERHRVKACMSRVWVKAVTDPGNPDAVRFEGECDTAIIKGVLALLIELASGKTAQEIQRLDVDEVFRRLALDENLSPNRHVGVYAIVDLMKQQAQECALEPPSARYA
jgi:cysteine desulfuration protein SufE